MYDAGKIIPGLIIFVVLMTFPIWRGVAGTVPKPEKPTVSRQCVKDTAYMRKSHMVLLDEWRDEALREGKRERIVVEGKEYDKSLMLGCMKCHTVKKKFCDECHTYTSVTPYCWDCHFVPKETL
ncbi:MAG: sulfate reduction electron transfer complex DsrMKJOP subunit DsrJ [Thermodesulfobacteriota bacterium]